MKAIKTKNMTILLLSVLIAGCSEDTILEKEKSLNVDLSDAYEVRRLTFDTSWESEFMFSPDGTKICYAKGDEKVSLGDGSYYMGIGDYYMMDSDGSDRRLVPVQEWVDNYYGSWGSDYIRDGKGRVSTEHGNICFEYYDMRENGMYHVSREYKTDYGLSGNKTQVAISPNGDKVVFVLKKSEDDPDQSSKQEKDPCDDLCVVENGKLTRFKSSEKAKEGIFLGVNLEYITGPCFSSDGRQIVFSGMLEGDRDIFILSLDNILLTRLTLNEANDDWAVISPDDRKIVFHSERSGYDDMYIMDLTRPTGK